MFIFYLSLSIDSGPLCCQCVCRPTPVFFSFHRLFPSATPPKFSFPVRFCWLFLTPSFVFLRLLQCPVTHFAPPFASGKLFVIKYRHTHTHQQSTFASGLSVKASLWGNDLCRLLQEVSWASCTFVSKQTKYLSGVCVCVRHLKVLYCVLYFNVSLVLLFWPFYCVPDLTFIDHAVWTFQWL